MYSIRTSRFLLPAVAFTAFLTGASMVLLSEEPDKSVGGQLMEEMKKLDEVHTGEMHKLRNEIRAQLNVVRRARLDKAMAAEAAAASGKISAVLNKLLDAESVYQTKLEEATIAKRDPLIAELTQQMVEGKEAAPGLMASLLPTVCGTDKEKTEWGDLFKMVKRNPRFDDGSGGGGDDDEGFD